MRLRGIGASPGLVAGRALVLETRETTIFQGADRPFGDRGRSQTLPGGARLRARADPHHPDMVARNLGDSVAQIFEAQILILEEDSLSGETVRQIREEKVNAEWASRPS